MKDSKPFDYIKGHFGIIMKLILCTAILLAPIFYMAPASVAASCPGPNSTSPGAQSPICTSSLPGSSASGNSGNATSSELKTILDAFFGVIGALSLLMITVSGLRYVLSDGDPNQAKQAREGIIYSLVGLMVALLAGAIVTFALGNI